MRLPFDRRFRLHLHLGLRFQFRLGLGLGLCVGLRGWLFLCGWLFFRLGLCLCFWPWLWLGRRFFLSGWRRHRGVVVGRPAGAPKARVRISPF